jgi:hypothetical protein
VFSLAQANKIDSIKPFEIIKYLTNEGEYIPWSAFISRISFYIDMLESSDFYGEFESYIRELVRPIYEKLTWDNSPIDSWLTR